MGLADEPTKLAGLPLHQSHSLPDSGPPLAPRPIVAPALSLLSQPQQPGLVLCPLPCLQGPGLTTLPRFPQGTCNLAIMLLLFLFKSPAPRSSQRLP